MSIDNENEPKSGHDRVTTPHRAPRGTASCAPTPVKQKAVARLLTLSKTTRAGRGTARWTRDELHDR